MTTRFIGIKELRQEMAKIAGEALKKRQRLIVLRKNRPVFELRPLSRDEEILDTIMLDIEKARQDVKKGRVYSASQVKKILGF